MAKPDKANKGSSALREPLSWIQITVIAAVVAFVFNNFLIAGSRIPMGSMENTIITGDHMIGPRLSYRFRKPKRNDVVISHWPDNEEVLFVKRIIGMSGDKVTIRDGHVYLDDSEMPLKEPYIKGPMVVELEKTFQVSEGAHFRMGDNRNESMDMRYWKNNHVYKNRALAKALFRYWLGTKDIH